jgi:hypothetical protein
MAVKIASLLLPPQRYLQTENRLLMAYAETETGQFSDVSHYS